MINRFKKSSPIKKNIHNLNNIFTGIIPTSLIKMASKPIKTTTDIPIKFKNYLIPTSVG